MSSVTLSVCPHDTVRNSEGWFSFVQYLTTRLGLEVHFNLSLDFADFHSRFAECDLVYANPSDAVTLLDMHGFTALVRPADTFDEALVVAGADAPAAGIEALAGAPVATVAHLLPTKLGLRMLGQQGIKPGALLDRDSWLSVVRAVWGGEAPYGFLYRDAYEELSPQGKGMVRVLAATSEGCAFHMLCGGPRLGDAAAKLVAALTAMAAEPAGQALLRELRMPGWQAVSPGDLTCVREVLAS
jgi:ABC-type phosphate/phosphonate transport system substrate-binding protein